MPVKKPETPKFAITQTTPANPYERDGNWWFYDEAGCENGPYGDEATAALELERYCEAYLQERKNDVQVTSVTNLRSAKGSCTSIPKAHGIFLAFHGSPMEVSLANYIGYLQNGPLKVDVVVVDPATELHVNAKEPEVREVQAPIGHEHERWVVGKDGNIFKGGKIILTREGGTVDRRVSHEDLVKALEIYHRHYGHKQKSNE